MVLPKWPFVAISLFVIILSACTHTRIVGQREPGFATATYRSFLIYCSAEDENVRWAVEEAMAKELERHGIPGQGSLSLLTEARPYTEPEVLELMAAAGHEGLLRIDVSTWATDLVEQPGGFFVFGGHYGFVEYYDPPYLEERSRLELGLVLLDGATGKTAWSGAAWLNRSGDRPLSKLSIETGGDFANYLRRHKLAR